MIENLANDLIRTVNLFTGKYPSNATTNQRRDSGYRSHCKCLLYRGSYMGAHVLLNLLNELGKRDKMRGLPSILSLFGNEFDKFNNTRARMLDSIYHMPLRLL